MSLAWRMPGRLSRPLGVLYSHFHLSFSTCRMVMQLKKMHPTKMYLLDCENRKCATFHSHHLQPEFCVFFLPCKVRKRLAWWCSLGFSIGSLAAHPKPPHSLLPLQDNLQVIQWWLTAFYFQVWSVLWIQASFISLPTCGQTSHSSSNSTQAHTPTQALPPESFLLVYPFLWWMVPNIWLITQDRNLDTTLQPFYHLSLSAFNSVF